MNTYTISSRYIQQVQQFCAVGVYLQHQLKQYVRQVRSCISRSGSICTRCVRTRVPGMIGVVGGTYVQQQVRTYGSWQFFSSIYVRTSTLGTCRTYISRYSRYLSTLQQHIFFPIYIYVRTSAVQHVHVQQYVVRSTVQHQVQYVRVPQVQWKVQQVRKYSYRYISSSCSACVITAVGAVVGSVITCVTSLQRPRSAIDDVELHISLLTSIYNYISFCAFIGLCDRVRFFANTRILDLFHICLFTIRVVFFPRETTANNCCLTCYLS